MVDEPQAAALARLDAAQLRELIARRIAARPAGESPIEDWRLGTQDAAQRARLRQFFPAEPVPAAVLVPLVTRDDQLTLLLTQRATQLRNHAGQISFPGGRYESADGDLVNTALRESEEEIGLERRHVQIVGRLPDHLIVSGFRVTPVVGFVAPGFALTLDPEEVAGTFEVPLSFILDPANHVKRVRDFEGHAVELTDMPFGEYNIWGATASMLMTFYRVLRGEDA